MNLEELEAVLQHLIEVSLVQSLPGNNFETLVTKRLAAAMRLNSTTQADGTRLAPTEFTLIVSPQGAVHWQSQTLLDSILRALRVAGEQSGLKFSSAPTIALAFDNSLGGADIRVAATHRSEDLEDTSAAAVQDSPLEQAPSNPGNAFLIIEGVKVFPVSEPVLNIGRRMDNQLVIDDPRVSKNHAQLRIIKDRVVLFDLNSTGGTFVNGQRTSQCVLYAGDVISLAGVALIFG